MSSRLDAAVVGGGVMGASLARALARAGHAVTWWAAELGDGASGVPIALLNPYRGRSGRAHPEDLATLRVTWRWNEELHAAGLAPGAHRSGVLRLADGERQARAFGNGAGAATPRHGRAAATVSVGARRRVGRRGWLDRSVRVAGRAGGRRRGARRDPKALPGRRDRAGPRGARALAVDGDDGTHAQHDRVLLATGAAAWPAGWERVLGEPVAFERLAGDVFPTRLPAPTVPLAGASYVGPVVDDRGFAAAAIGGHHRPPGPAPDDAGRRLVANLSWAWPALEETQLRTGAAWWGVRAHGEGNRPQLREIAPGAWWVGALAGRGFVVAAALAEAAVRAVAER
jgi:glycine/D-amino acid oxidase-like deaminating enzyme